MNYLSGWKETSENRYIVFKIGIVPIYGDQQPLCLHMRRGAGVADLEPNQTYEVCVISNNPTCSSEASQPFNFVTKRLGSDTVKPPTKPHVVEHNADWVVIKWLHSENADAFVTYTLQYSTDNCRTWLSLIDNMNTPVVRVNGILTKYSYWFRVIAFCLNCVSEPSEASECYQVPRYKRPPAKIKSQKTVVAVCQMIVTHDVDSNFEMATQLIERACLRGAQMVFLPECFDFIGQNRQETASLSTTENGDIVSKYRALATKHRIWLSLGGFLEKDSADELKVYNSHLILNSKGDTMAKYRKLHLFDVDIGGTSLVLPVETPVGKIGLGICYDLLFAEFSCWLRQNGAQILTYPSAFNVKTGSAHWECLLRARAIETQCYVLAAAQTGRHNENRMSYGHAMIVDPWGTIVAQCRDDVDVCVAEIDLNHLQEVRERLPYEKHRRNDLYYIDPTKVEFQFGSHKISSACVIYETELSYEFVNRKPVVKGHILIAPLRPAKKFTDLTIAEISDMYSVVQKIQAALETFYGVTSSTISMQDGPDAGQTVDHIHVHLLPRRKGDFAQNDEVYKQLDRHDKEESNYRSIEEMGVEAEIFRNLLK